MSCSQKKHVIALPFPFTSHPSILAKLVVRLAGAAPDVHFSFLNTVKSNLVIFPPAQKLPANIRIYDIEAPSSGQNHLQEVKSFFDTAPQSYEVAMEAAVAESGVQVSCLLTDVMTPSASEMVTKMGVDWVALWVAASYSLLAHLYTDAIMDELRLHFHHDGNKKKKIDFISGLSMIQVGDLPNEILQVKSNNMNAVSRALAEVNHVLPKATAVILNSFEQENLTEVTSTLRSKLRTLLHIPDISAITRLSDSDQSGCLSWLDQKRANNKSVVYVGFGTIALKSPNEISAIAEALEDSETPYVWALKEELKIHLPSGFLERTRNNGKIVLWAPQTLILSHPSVAAHLTHAGYNSMVESIVGEVPLICRPLWADNMMNARMIEEVWRIGVVVEGGIVTKNGLLNSLEMVLGNGEKGKMMKENIKALKEIMLQAVAPNGSATKDFNSLVQLISK